MCCSRRRQVVGWLLAVLVLAGPVRANQTTREADLAEAERLFNEFQNAPAAALIDQLEPRLSFPDDAALLARAYALRARARFNLGEVAGAREDFVSLLGVDGSYRLPDGVTPRLVTLFEEIRAITIGRLFVTADPPVMLVIDGREVPMSTPDIVVELAAGVHQIEAQLPGYRTRRDEVTLEAGRDYAMPIALVLASGSISVATSPPGARVLVDDVDRGITVPSASPDGPSAPLLVLDLDPGEHSLRLERPCSVPYGVPFNIPDPPVDANVGVIELAPAVATAVIDTTASDAMVYVDGEPSRRAPVTLDDLCAGEHVIEVRSPRGRFIDRREWKPGDRDTLQARLRQAFLLLADQPDDRLPARVEEALGDADTVMIALPLGPAVDADGRSDISVVRDPSRTVLDRQEAAMRLAEHFSSQGVAWLSPAAGSRDEVEISLLARGSGTPDIVRLQLGDVGSRVAAVRRLSLEPPATVQPSLELSLVDVADVTGAAIVRVPPGGVGADAGLAVGDIIVGIDGTPITSAADVARAIAGRGGETVTLGLASSLRDGDVSVLIASVADAIPLGDTTRLRNPLLVDLETAVANAATPLAVSAARLNLAIVHMQLQNWDHALRELATVTLPDGPGVSAGTVAYLTGLCLLEVSQMADAEQAFRRAVDVPESRLFVGGPPVAVLAQQRLDELGIR